MIIPPNNGDAATYFKSLSELNKSLALENISMGMSADYIEAVKHGSTFVSGQLYLWFSILTFALIFKSFTIFIKCIF